MMNKKTNLVFDNADNALLVYSLADLTLFCSVFCSFILNMYNNMQYKHICFISKNIATTCFFLKHGRLASAILLDGKYG